MSLHRFPAFHLVLILLRRVPSNAQSSMLRADQNSVQLILLKRNLRFPIRTKRGNTRPPEPL